MIEMLRKLTPNNELRLPYTNANKTLVYRCCDRAGVQIQTRTADGYLYIRLKGVEIPRVTAIDGLEIVPIGAPPPEEVADSPDGHDPSRFLLWATKLGEPVPTHLLDAMPRSELLARLSAGTFKKVYSHPLLTERNDVRYLEDAE